MLESQKSILRGVSLGLLGFLIGVLGVSAYSGTAGWKDAWKNLFSFTTRDVKENPRITLACTLDQKSEAEQIFFLTCGGIF